MTEYRFNPPPGWSVPPGWTPPADWLPDPSWPVAPAGWQFWVAGPGAPEPAAGLSMVETAAPLANRSGSLRVGLLAGAVGLVVVLVLSSVALVWWWRSDTEAALPAGMLAGTYPSAPAPAWTVDVETLGGGADVRFGQPVFNRLLAADPGASVIDGTVVATTWGSGTGDGQLHGIDLDSGKVKWSRPDALRGGCAFGTVTGMLACIRANAGSGGTRIDFIDPDDGGTKSSGTVDRRVDMIATDGEYVYLGGLDSDTGQLVLSKGTPENLGGGGRFAMSNRCAEPGDSMELTVSHGFVHGLLGNGEEMLLHSKDLRPVVDYPVKGAAVLGPDAIAVQRCDNPVQPAEVLDRTGKVKFTAEAPVLPYTMDVHTGAEAPLLTRSGAVLDPVSGQTLWRVAGRDDDSAAPRWLVGDQLIVSIDARLTAYSAFTGQRLWSATDRGYSMSATTDGGVAVFPVEGGITALGLEDGRRQWFSDSVRWMGGIVRVFATPAGLLSVSNSRVALMKPTGPGARVPALTDPRQPVRGSGDKPRLVTRCGAPPTLTPQQIRTDTGGLVIVMRLTARCPGGDVLSSPRTRITVTSGGQNVASGVFDLSGDPIAVPPNSSGGGTGGDGVDVEFRFTPGTFWRVPVTVDGAPTPGSDSGNVDLRPESLLVECESAPGGAESAELPEHDRKKTATVAGPGAPAHGDDESTSFDALRELANADRPFVTGQLTDRWVAQLSSKQPGLVADGITWDNAGILREHLDLRLRHPEVRLLWTGDWSTFSAPDFWVTVAGLTYPDADGALGWCRDRGFDRDHCYAKLVSAHHPIDGSTAYLP